MAVMKSLPMIVVSAILTFGTPVSAQTTQDPHHPNQAAAPSQKQSSAKRPGSSETGSHSGMMMPGCEMMMGMMRQGGMGMPDSVMPGMQMSEHVEGRIAFLRAELKISDNQEKVWNDFANALRDAAKKLNETRGAMGMKMGAQTVTITQRLDQQEAWYAARLDGIRALKVPFTQLYAALSDDQKKVADQLLGPHLGLMPMAGMSMGGMQTGGMQSGSMSPGGMPMGGTQ